MVALTFTAAQPGRPVGAVGEETRQRIIDAAMRCVAEVGYSKATIRQIARTADITSGSLYHYFPNKSALLGAAVAAMDAIALPRLCAAARSSTDVIERLEAVLDESDRLLREHPDLITFERAMRAESAANQGGVGRGRSAFPPLRTIIGDIITAAQREGALVAGADVQGASEMIYALIRTLTEQAASLPPDTYHAALRSTKQLIRGTLL